MKRIQIILACLALTMLAAACRTTAPLTVKRGGVACNWSEGWMAKRIEVADVITATRNELMTVQVSLRNNGEEEFWPTFWRYASFQFASPSRKDVALEYRFRWFDKEGLLLDAQTTTWQPVVIRNKFTEVIRGLATSSNAVSCTVDVRVPVVGSNFAQE